MWTFTTEYGHARHTNEKNPALPDSSPVAGRFIEFTKTLDFAGYIPALKEEEQVLF